MYDVSDHAIMTEQQAKLIAEELKQAFIIGVAQSAGHFDNATIEEIVAVILDSERELKC